MYVASSTINIFNWPDMTKEATTLATIKARIFNRPILIKGDKIIMLAMY